MLGRYRAGAPDGGETGPEAGFSVVEVMIAMGIFAIVAAAFAATLTSSLRVQVVTRLRTTADHLATEQVERARALPYDQVGVVGGNPSGTLPASTVAAAGAVQLRVETSVGFRDDPIPGGFSTFANYKELAVVVRRVDDGRVLARVETVIAPPTQPSLRNGVVQARIVDHALNEPLLGARVRLQSGPGGTRSATTPADGSAVFPALTPNPTTGPLAFYEVVGELDGYVTLREDRLPSPAARTQLAAGQVFSTVLRLYRPAAIEVDLRDAADLPILAPSVVIVRSDRGVEAYPVTGGHLAITSVAGEPVVPGLEYTVGATTTGAVSPVARAVVPPDYPNELTSRFVLRPAATATQRLRVRLRNDAGTPLVGVTVVASGGPADTIAAGVTNNGGEALLDVPVGTSLPYTVTALPPAGHAADETSVTMSGNPNSTTVATLVLPRHP